jgi:hypothetical protein
LVKQSFLQLYVLAGVAARQSLQLRDSLFRLPANHEHKVPLGAARYASAATRLAVRQLVDSQSFFALSVPICADAGTFRIKMLALAVAFCRTSH